MAAISNGTEKKHIHTDNRLPAKKFSKHHREKKTGTRERNVEQEVAGIMY